MPPLRLWLFNHPLRYITEQVEFFCLASRAAGYQVSVSNRPSPGALNVLIENFSPRTTPEVAAFCRQHRKRVAVVMTEHIDFVAGEVRFHGSGMEAHDDYMASLSKMGRLFSLLTLTDHVRCFFRLGDLPELRNFGEMVPGVPVRTIPFPVLSPSDRALPGARRAPTHDFVFTGKVTQHRAAVLAQLNVRYQVLSSSEIVSRRKRDAMNAAARFTLNIPQNADWRWISTMRVLAALRCRRATVAIGAFEHSAAAAFCLLLSNSDLKRGKLDQPLGEYDNTFEHFFAKYESFVRSGGNPEFPHDEFDLWAQLEL